MFWPVIVMGYWYSDVMMSAMAFHITTVSMVCSTVCPGADQRKHQSPAVLAFMRGIHWWPVNSPHKSPVTRIMFPFVDVIVNTHNNDQSLGGCPVVSMVCEQRHIVSPPLISYDMLGVSDLGDATEEGDVLSAHCWRGGRHGYCCVEGVWKLLQSGDVMAWIRFPHYCPLLEATNCGRWFPLTNGQQYVTLVISLFLSSRSCREPVEFPTVWEVMTVVSMG